MRCPILWSEVLGVWEVHCITHKVDTIPGIFFALLFFGKDTSFNFFGIFFLPQNSDRNPWSSGEWWWGTANLSHWLHTKLRITSLRIRFWRLGKTCSPFFPFRVSTFPGDTWVPPINRFQVTSMHEFTRFF